MSEIPTYPNECEHKRIPERCWECLRKPKCGHCEIREEDTPEKTLFGGLCLVCEAKENEIEMWNRDPAASGWRSRAFLTHGEVLVYDDGWWEVRTMPSGQTVATDKAENSKSGKERALAVYTALTGQEPEMRKEARR